MRQVVFGHTGERVSALCLGCMHFGTRVDEETSRGLLDQYADCGGGFLDTANNYAFWVNGFVGGESEELLGRWMRDRGNRNDIFLATKVGAKPLFEGGSFEDAEGLSAEAITRAAEESLRRLKTDRIDLYYAHIDDRTTPWRRRWKPSTGWSDPARSGTWAAPTRRLGGSRRPGTSAGPTVSPGIAACSSATPISGRGLARTSRRSSLPATSSSTICRLAGTSR